MTPFIAPPPSGPASRQANAAIQSRQPSSAEISAAGDPFALHLDAAAEKASGKRFDKQASHDAKHSKDAAPVKEAPPQQKSRKDAAKKSADARKKENAPKSDDPADEAQDAEAAANQNDEAQTDPVAGAESTEQVTAEDACHQQDSLFVQALMNQKVPENAEEVAPQFEGMHEEPPAGLKLPELPGNSQSAPQAKSDSPQETKASKQQAKVDLENVPVAHDELKPESTITAQAVTDPASAPVADEKPAPRATLPHLDAKQTPKDAAKHSEADSATTQALANAALSAKAPAQDAKLEVGSEMEPEPAPAPMPISPAHLQNQNAPSSQNVGSADSARAAQDSPRTTEQNTFDQIVLGLRTKMDAANQKANIELNPPNLGKLHVSVELSNGILTAQFRTSTDVVRDLLSAHMDQLRSVLEGQGIAVDKLAVSAGGATSEQNPQANTSTNQNASHDGRSGGAFANDRHGPRQSSSDAFGKMWRAALDKEEPIDLLA